MSSIFKILNNNHQFKQPFGVFPSDFNWNQEIDTRDGNTFAYFKNIRLTYLQHLQSSDKVKHTSVTNDIQKESKQMIEDLRNQLKEFRKKLDEYDNRYMNSTHTVQSSMKNNMRKNFLTMFIYAEWWFKWMIIKSLFLSAWYRITGSDMFQN